MNYSNQYDSDFQYGQQTAKKVSRAAMICCIISALMYFVNAFAQLVCMFITLALIIWVIYILARYCRCPCCGKHFYVGALQVKVCPRCHHDLYTGKKAKKKKI